MIFDILEQKIIDVNLGTPGSSLFRNFMPADCLQGVLLRAPLAGIAVDPTIIGWHKSRMQVVVRHTDPVDGYDYAMKVIKALTFQGNDVYPRNQERGEARLMLFFPETLPVQFPLLEGNAIEWSVHFKTAFSIEPDWYDIPTV